MCVPENKNVTGNWESDEAHLVLVFFKACTEEKYCKSAREIDEWKQTNDIARLFLKEEFVEDEFNDDLVIQKVLSIEYGFFQTSTAQI